MWELTVLSPSMLYQLQTEEPVHKQIGSCMNPYSSTGFSGIQMKD